MSAEDSRNELLEQILSAVSSGGDPLLKAQVDSNTAEIIGLALDLIGITTDHVTQTVTQWANANWLAEPIGVTDGSGYDLLLAIDNVGHKNSAVTDSLDELNITLRAADNLPVIKTTYRGQRTTHQIRLTMNITTGNDQHYEVQIKRGSDDSIVASYPVSRNPDSPIITVDLLTFTYKADDPYVTDGFYLEFRNDSGLTAEISGSYSLTIFNSYQYLTPIV